MPELIQEEEVPDDCRWFYSQGYGTDGIYIYRFKKGPRYTNSGLYREKIQNIGLSSQGQSCLGLWNY